MGASGIGMFGTYRGGGACPNCVDRINAINNILEEKING